MNIVIDSSLWGSRLRSSLLWDLWDLRSIYGMIGTSESAVIDQFQLVSTTGEGT